MRHTKHPGTRTRWFRCARCGSLNRAVKRGDKMTPPSDTSSTSGAGGAGVRRSKYK